MATGSTALVCSRSTAAVDRADGTAFQQIIDTCTHGEALADCPVIKPIPVATTNACTKKPSSDEVVTGTLSALPGGFAIRGPGQSPPTTPSTQSGPSDADPPGPIVGSPSPSSDGDTTISSVRPGASSTQTVSPFLRKVCKPDL